MDNNRELIPHTYRDATVIRELSVNTWKLILEASAELHRIRGKELSHDLMHNLLIENNSVDVRLITALRAIFDLGNDVGRDLLDQAGVDANLDMEISDDESHRELAARIWIKGQTDKKYFDVINRALAIFEYTHKPSSSIHEYAGETSFPVNLDKEEIENLVSKWCKENKKNEVVSIDIFHVNDFWFCNIVRGDAIKKVSEIKDRTQAELRYRPAVCDNIRLDPSTGRIGINCRSDKLISAYREIFGKILADKRDFFSGEKICSLEILRKNGPIIFDKHKPHDLRAVTVTELKWQRGGVDTVIAKGNDCFKIFNDLGVKLNIGQLIEAKLAFDFFGQPRFVRVSVKVPNRIYIFQLVTMSWSYLNILQI